MTQPQMAPICLVENHNEQLLVNQEAIEILDKISQPVVVVAIVGWSHTGKSYLMNCLAGQNHVSGTLPTSQRFDWLCHISLILIPNYNNGQQNSFLAKPPSHAKLNPFIAAPQ